MTATVTRPFDFSTAPLTEAQRRLAELEDILRRARSAVGQRLNAQPPKLVCWCHEHQHRVPESVKRQCRGNIADERGVMFRDNGAIDEEGRVYSAVVCSMLCFTVYQQQSQRMKSEAKATGAAR